MSGGWVNKPAAPHGCVKPRVGNGLVGGVWRCSCGRLWVHRTGWWFGDFPPWWRRTVPAWHRARWWERFKHWGDKPLDEVELPE